jgi:hypothetical protein
MHNILKRNPIAKIQLITKTWRGDLKRRVQKLFGLLPTKEPHTEPQPPKRPPPNPHGRKGTQAHQDDIARTQLENRGNGEPLRSRPVGTGWPDLVGEIAQREWFVERKSIPVRTAE